MKLSWTIPFILFAAGCASKASDNKSSLPAMKIPVVQLQGRDTSFAIDYVADIQAKQNIEIRARVQGYIDHMYVDEGAYVKKGQLLFRLSDKEYRIGLSKARANFASAESAVKIAEVELGRISILVDKKVISASEKQLGEARLKEAVARKDEALAAVDEAEHKLSFTAVCSPFDGVIDRIPFKTGSLVSDGVLLTTLSDNRQMYAYFDVSENEYLQYKRASESKLSENKTASLILADGSHYPLDGKIETHESEFSDNTGSIAFRAVFPNPDNVLKHGASGKVQLRSKLNNSIMIPQKSVFELQDKNYVFLMGEDSMVTIKSFAPKLRIADFYVVDTGLVAGQRIVYEGVQNIKDGSHINPVYKNLDSLIKAQ